MLVRRGYGLLLAPFAPRLRSQTSVFTGFGEGHSRLVETKWSVASVFAVKHNGFETFLFQEDLELPWPPHPRRCFLEASQMTPRRLPGLIHPYIQISICPYQYQFISISQKSLTLKSMICWSKNVQLHFLEFSGHQIGTIFKSFALIFQSAPI